jgi:quercetin dioxygenase-like cupin family protein
MPGTKDLHTSETNSRPTVSELTTTAEGRFFTVEFLSGQRLPTHQNSARVRIAVTAGAGILTVDGRDDLVFETGDVVQLEAGEPHSLLAGSSGMSVKVTLIAACCQSC